MNDGDAANRAPRQKSSLRRPIALMVVSLIVIWSAAVGVFLWRKLRARDEPLARADAEFSPAITALTKGGVEDNASYDIDATIRTLHEMEIALADGGDPTAWLGPLAKQDYRRVPRDVLDSRAELLRILQRMYALQNRQKVPSRRGALPPQHRPRSNRRRWSQPRPSCARIYANIPARQPRRCCCSGCTKSGVAGPTRRA